MEDHLYSTKKTARTQGSRSTGGRCQKHAEADKSDLREQLVNGAEVGDITDVSLPETMITLLRGMMLDLDPRLLRKKVVPSEIRAEPKKFYEQIVSTWLARHPVLGKAEVRNSGTGLHVILRFDAPVEFQTEGERQRWAGMTRTIQKLLPTDPNCPGITALTRPVGSVNSKNGAKVRLYRKGQPVTADEVIALYEEVQRGPFRAIAHLLFGCERITPCPVCKGDGTRLDALDHVGKCYGGCGKVSLGQLFDAFLKPRKKEG
jgi:hypothetical protein